MWCVGRITAEYRRRMYGLLKLYARPYDAAEPVVCVDEKSKQLLAQTRAPLPARPGQDAKEDYEYRRADTRNLFVAVEPKGGHREVTVTSRRAKPDFVKFIVRLAEGVYASARKIHLVADNLNTHFRASFDTVLGLTRARALFARVQFHYTPKHASWLNMAEIEIGVLERQCLGQRIPDVAQLRRHVRTWQRRRNRDRATIRWRFTRQDADRKLGRHYVA